MMMLKSQHKRDKNMKFPERALRTVGTHTKRHSASLMWRCQREHSLAPSLRDGLKEETDARVPADAGDLRLPPATAAAGHRCH